MTQRTDRIDELLRQEIGQALEREVADPRIGFVTVTDVQTTPDLANARVWVSIIGSAEERKATLTALRRAMPYILHGLGAKIRLRRIPELEVRLDESVERGTRVLRIINQLEAGRLPEDEIPAGESLPTPVPRLPHEGDAEAQDAADGEAAAAVVQRRKSRAGSKGRPDSKGRQDSSRPTARRKAR